MWDVTPQVRDFPRTFVSFASGDKEFVRRLFARLKSQPLCLWIFESDRGEIPGGKYVTEYLEQMLSEAAFVVPILSKNAFRSEYVRHEVEFSLTRTGESAAKILPLVRAGLDQRPEIWPDSFAPLRQIRYRTVEFDSVSSLELAVMKICKDAGVEYEPALTDTFRLPFMGRFLQEVRDFCPRRHDLEIDIFNRLMVVLASFTAAMDKNSLAEAQSQIEYFIAICDNEFPDSRFYYPRLVRAVCQLLQRSNDEALATFESLLNHPGVDESVFGGIGRIKEVQGDYQNALPFFVEAHRRDPDDLAAQIGVLTNSIMSSLPVALDLQGMRRRIDHEEKELRRSNIDPRVMTALVCLAEGKPEDACTTLSQVTSESEVPMLAVALHAMILDKEFDDQNSVIAMLQGVHGRQPCPEILHRLATYCAFAGRVKEAALYFRELVIQNPLVRQFRVEAAQTLWFAEGPNEAVELASEAFRGSYPTPSCEDDYYWDGFANWIVGRFDLAEYDFWRSGKPDDMRYDQVFPEALQHHLI